MCRRPSRSPACRHRERGPLTRRRRSGGVPWTVSSVWPNSVVRGGTRSGRRPCTPRSRAGSPQQLGPVEQLEASFGRGDSSIFRSSSATRSAEITGGLSRDFIAASRAGGPARAESRARRRSECLAACAGVVGKRAHGISRRAQGPGLQVAPPAEPVVDPALKVHQQGVDREVAASKVLFEGGGADAGLRESARTTPSGAVTNSTRWPGSVTCAVP